MQTGNGNIAGARYSLKFDLLDIQISTLIIKKITQNQGKSEL